MYFGWFDTAWIGWLGDAALIARDGPTVFIAENGCRYLAELHFPGDVEIGMAVVRVGTSSLAVRFGAFAAGASAPAAEGHCTYVCVDRATRRPMPLPEEWRLRLAEVAAAG